MGHPPNRAVAALDRGQHVTIRIPIAPGEGKTEVSLRAAGIAGETGHRYIVRRLGRDDIRRNRPAEDAFAFVRLKRGVPPPGELVLDIAVAARAGFVLG